MKGGGKEGGGWREEGGGRRMEGGRKKNGREGGRTLRTLTIHDPPF